MIKLVDVLKQSNLRQLTPEEERNAHAAFIVHKTPDNKILATTRPADKNQLGQVGLPGGKVEDGETPKEAAMREAEEEGWKLTGGKLKLIASFKSNDKDIVYFEYVGGTYEKVEDHKEEHRAILPVELSIDIISRSGFNNEFIEIYYGESNS